ncbi:CCA tRNA nucleotidyltransferase [Patescibacteria group bacterium]|nr:CCA tRNA nucleotidyltransferase [Patescibacteria group bacterium]
MKPTSIQIIEKLKQAGYQAYWAGGCVRDMLMGHEPKDFDIATSAKPEEIEDLLDYTKPVGKEFGVILVIEGGHAFEVATFRSDSGYSDGRRPDAVFFSNPEADALRRDFTINGMFYDPIADKIFDYVGGEKDIEAKLINFIGDPHERILEDHLRILRAVRFKNQFNFQYNPDTYNALKKHAKLASKVSMERIFSELNKMIEGPNPAQAIEDLSELKILEEIIPELEKLRGVPQPLQYHHEGDVWDHSLKALAECDKHAPRNVKWACLMHDIGKPDTFDLEERIRFYGHAEKGAEIAGEILRRLKFPKKDRLKVQWLITHHMMMEQLIEMNPGRARAWFLKEEFLQLMQVFEADAKGIIPVDLSLYDKILARYRKLMAQMPHMPKPLVTGKDVMKMLGMKPGKEVGEIVGKAFHQQLDGKIKTRTKALAFIQKFNKKK